MSGHRVSRSTVYTGGCRGVFAVFGGCVPGVLGQNSVCIFYMFKRCRIVKDDPAPHHRRHVFGGDGGCVRFVLRQLWLNSIMSNYYGVRGNARSLHRLFHWAMDGTFTWLKRRGGKRSSSTWEQFTRVLDRVKIARPRMTEVPRRRVFARRLGFAPRERGTTEEPDAGKLHVRDCTGGAG